MTELEFFKFVTDNNVEYHWHENEGEKDVILMPSFSNLRQLCELLGYNALDEGGIECVLKDGYICIWMRELLEEHFGFTLSAFFKTQWDA